MSDTSSHGSVEQLLPGAALEILDGEDLARVQFHLRECDACAQLLERYRQALSVVGLALPDQKLDPARSERLRSRLVDRARATSGAGAAAGSTADPNPAPAAGALTRWTGWAVAASLAGLLLAHHAIHRPLAYGWLAAGVLAMALTALGIYAAWQRRRLKTLQERLSQLHHRPEEP